MLLFREVVGLCGAWYVFLFGSLCSCAGRLVLFASFWHSAALALLDIKLYGPFISKLDWRSATIVSTLLSKTDSASLSCAGMEM